MATITTEISTKEEAQHILPIRAEQEAQQNAKVENSEEKPKIRRLIDEEGGTTTASVRLSHLLVCRRL
jgi:hypothetical protein